MCKKYPEKRKIEKIAGFPASKSFQSSPRSETHQRTHLTTVTNTRVEAFCEQSATKALSRRTLIVVFERIRQIWSNCVILDTQLLCVADFDCVVVVSVVVNIFVLHINAHREKLARGHARKTQAQASKTQTTDVCGVPVSFTQVRLEK